MSDNSRHYTDSDGYVHAKHTGCTHENCIYKEIKDQYQGKLQSELASEINAIKQQREYQQQQKEKEHRKKITERRREIAKAREEKMNKIAERRKELEEKKEREKKEAEEKKKNNKEADRQIRLQGKEEEKKRKEAEKAALEKMIEQNKAKEQERSSFDREEYARKVKEANNKIEEEARKKAEEKKRRDELIKEEWKKIREKEEERKRKRKEELEKEKKAREEKMAKRREEDEAKLQSFRNGKEPTRFYTIPKPKQEEISSSRQPRTIQHSDRFNEIKEFRKIGKEEDGTKIESIMPKKTPEEIENERIQLKKIDDDIKKKQQQIQEEKKYIDEYSLQSSHNMKQEQTFYIKKEEKKDTNQSTTGKKVEQTPEEVVREKKEKGNSFKEEQSTQAVEQSILQTTFSGDSKEEKKSLEPISEKPEEEDNKDMQGLLNEMSGVKNTESIIEEVKPEIVQHEQPTITQQQSEKKVEKTLAPQRVSLVVEKNNPEDQISSLEQQLREAEARQNLFTLELLRTEREKNQILTKYTEQLEQSLVNNNKEERSENTQRQQMTLQMKNGSISQGSLPISSSTSKEVETALNDINAKIARRIPVEPGNIKNKTEYEKLKKLVELVSIIYNVDCSLELSSYSKNSSHDAYAQATAAMAEDLKKFNIEEGFVTLGVVVGKNHEKTALEIKNIFDEEVKKKREEKLKILKDGRTGETLFEILEKAKIKGDKNKIVNESFKEQVIRVLESDKKLSATITAPAGAGKTSALERFAYEIENTESNGPKICLYEADGNIIISKAGEVVGYSARTANEILEYVRFAANYYGQAPVLCYDEFHTLFSGKDKTAEGLLNGLKPSMGDGKLRMLGITTSHEYETIVKPKFVADGALERRFQAIDMILLERKLIKEKLFIKKLKENFFLDSIDKEFSKIAIIADLFRRDARPNSYELYLEALKNEYEKCFSPETFQKLKSIKSLQERLNQQPNNEHGKKNKEQLQKEINELKTKDIQEQIEKANKEFFKLENLLSIAQGETKFPSPLLLSLREKEIKFSKVAETIEQKASAWEFKSNPKDDEYVDGVKKEIEEKFLPREKEEEKIKKQGPKIESNTITFEKKPEPKFQNFKIQAEEEKYGFEQGLSAEVQTSELNEPNLSAIATAEESSPDEELSNILSELKTSTDTKVVQATSTEEVKKAEQSIQVEQQPIVESEPVKAITETEPPVAKQTETAINTENQPKKDESTFREAKTIEQIEKSVQVTPEEEQVESANNSTKKQHKKKAKTTTTNTNSSNSNNIPSNYSGNYYGYGNSYRQPYLATPMNIAPPPLISRKDEEITTSPSLDNENEIAKQVGEEVAEQSSIRPPLTEPVMEIQQESIPKNNPLKTILLPAVVFAGAFLSVYFIAPAIVAVLAATVGAIATALVNHYFAVKEIDKLKKGVKVNYHHRSPAQSLVPEPYRNNIPENRQESFKTTNDEVSTIELQTPYKAKSQSIKPLVVEKVNPIKVS